MTRETDERHESKISSEFADRLAKLPEHQTVRAIVLPAPYMVDQRSTRPRGDERQAILREARHRTEEAFADVDAVLSHTGGQRVTESGNALGFIVVETTPGGVEALCGLDWVGTVMEDQAIHPLRNPKQPDDRQA